VNSKSKGKNQKSKGKRSMRVLIFAFCFLTFDLVSAEIFPPAHDLFAPLIADPRELQYSARAVVPVRGSLRGEASMGDYFGVYRWDQTPNLPMQISLGGGVFGRFNLEARTNDLEVADFYANLPLDVRSGQWSGRFMLYHTSSHAGDDYIARTGAQVVKHAWDILRMIGSYDWNAHTRVYAGYSYTWRTLPSDDRNAFQAGLELRSAWKGDHWRYFFANDFQSWERVDWNPMFASQLGVTWAPSPENTRTASFFIEYLTGHMPHGQFYRRQESRWGFGVRLTLV